VADELRRQSDQFIDLADLEQLICRDPATRPVRPDRAERPYPPRREGYQRSPAEPVPFQEQDDLPEEV
jgi:hypothetical protein